ncbi:MAG: bifunctional methylenetetrahydrofolate dehydrogenase/methenyltetrahydrofolate cyclohydrolase FolD [Elusimicrobiota bacterium]
MQDKIINGNDLAENIKSILGDEISKISSKAGRAPGLAVIIVGNNPASEIYVRLKKKDCDVLGIYSEVFALPENTAEKDLLKLISDLNMNNSIDGILVQLPLPKHINTDNVLDAIDPMKDVDCFHPYNLGLLFAGKPRFLPCTPAGVMELLKSKKINVSGKHAVVIGRSNIVGKPCALLLLSENATVTICHSKTKNIEEIVKKSDIVVAAIGKPKFINADMIKDGAVVIDVGINRVNGSVVGDVDFDSVISKASYITPVPKGVGPMTRAMLMQNAVKAYKTRNNIS